MTDHDHDQDRTRLLTSPLITAALPQLREHGDLTGPSLLARRGGWASWLTRNLTRVDTGRRRYAAIGLPGRFYDPTGRLAGAAPHLELPGPLLDRADGNFPLRLAAAGNGLLSPWWVPSEATAARRQITDPAATLPDDIVAVLDREADGFAAAVTTTIGRLADAFDEIAAVLAANPAGLRDLVADPADAAEIAAFWAPARRLGVTAALDRRLVDGDGAWVARRAGTWRISGDGWHVGVIAPRLTVSSFCTDPLWDPRREPATALVARGVLAARLAARVGITAAKVPPPAPRGHVTAVPTRSGQTPAQASVDAAVRFLRAHRDADTAWATLQRWAGRNPGRVLTVRRDAHRDAFRRGRRALARGETPTRADIDTILPLAWNGPTLARLTFTKA